MFAFWFWVWFIFCLLMIAYALHSIQFPNKRRIGWDQVIWFMLGAFAAGFPGLLITLYK